MKQRYSENFLRWAEHFANSSPTQAQPSDSGLAQFHDLESRGIRPQQPDPYFVRLDSGRSMFNALQKQIRESYGTEEWQGWAADKDSMPEWLFKALYSWHPTATRS